MIYAKKDHKIKPVCSENCRYICFYQIMCLYLLRFKQETHGVTVAHRFLVPLVKVRILVGLQKKSLTKYTVRLFLFYLLPFSLVIIDIDERPHSNVDSTGYMFFYLIYSATLLFEW